MDRINSRSKCTSGDVATTSPNRVVTSQNASYNSLDWQKNKEIRLPSDLCLVKHYQCGFCIGVPLDETLYHFLSVGVVFAVEMVLTTPK